MWVCTCRFMLSNLWLSCYCVWKHDLKVTAKDKPSISRKPPHKRAISMSICEMERRTDEVWAYLWTHPSWLSLGQTQGCSVSKLTKQTTVVGCNSGESPLVCSLANRAVIFIFFHLYPKAALPRCHMQKKKKKTRGKPSAKLHQNEKKYMFVSESLGE